MKKRKVLFTGLFPYFSYHFTAELNLVEQELSAGSDVYMLACDEYLQSCDCNPPHAADICSICINVRKEGLRRLSGPVTVLPLIAEQYRLWPGPEGLTSFSTLGDMKALAFEGFNAGAAAYSSLVDRAQSASPDVDEFRDVIVKLLQDGCRTYRSACEYLDSHGFDEVAIFNGRFSAARAWVQACEARGVPFYTHERTGNPKRIRKYHGSLPHDTTQYAPLVKAYCETANGDPDYQKNGEEFFRERPQGKLSSWWSYVKNQTPESLPEGFDSNKRNIAIFSSTEYEIAATADLYPRDVFTDQGETVAELVSGVEHAEPGNVMFYLRVHPHSAASQNRWWESEAIKARKNLVVIDPLSSISSYALLYACEMTVVWGSTMGIEATFWGKPSILLGVAFYSGIDCVYEPRSIDEAVALIVDRVPAKDRENAVAFGAFHMNAGIDLPFSEVINHYQLTFKGSGLWETTPDPVSEQPVSAGPSLDSQPHPDLTGPSIGRPPVSRGILSLTRTVLSKIRRK